MHPLVKDLSKLTLEELHKKHGDLLSRRLSAFRMGNAELIHQIDLVLQNYKHEIDTRAAKELEEIEKKSKAAGLNKIIDIK